MTEDPWSCCRSYVKQNLMSCSVLPRYPPSSGLDNRARPPVWQEPGLPSNSANADAFHAVLERTHGVRGGNILGEKPSQNTRIRREELEYSSTAVFLLITGNTICGKSTRSALRAYHVGESFNRFQLPRHACCTHSSLAEVYVYSSRGLVQFVPSLVSMVRGFIVCL